MCEHGEPKGEKYCALCRNAGLLAGDRGMAQAIEAKPEWTAQAKEYIETLIRANKPFTSEDIIEAVGLPAGDVGINRNNALGAIINAYARKHRIFQCGTRPATRRTSHGHELKVWRGGYHETPKETDMLFT